VVAARPITEIGDPNAGRDVWVAGNGGGYKYIDPIGKQLSAKNLPEPFFLTFPAMGFYNDAVDDGKLLYISHTGSKGFAKYITFAGEEAQNRVRYEIQQVPADMHHIDTYSMPYEVVLAHLRGDWWDVADTYRTFLRKDVDWYHGPVGHPDSGRSAAARDTLFTTTIHQVGIVRGSRKKGFFQANNQTLDFDIDVRKHLGAEIQRYADVFGGRGTHIVYGATEFAEHPEYSRFDQWYQRPLTYLPGLYNLIDFANESVAYLGGQNVAPYVQGSVAWAEDSQVPAGPSNSFTQMMLASAVRNEVGEPVKAHWGTPTNPATSNFMCPGEGKWHFNLPFEAAMIKEHTTTSDEPGLKHRYAAFITEYLQVDGPVRAERDFSLFGEDPRTVPGHGFNSFYLDYFMGFTECFDPSHGHPIGGGSWFTQAKMDQMKFLKALYRDDPVYLPTEGLNGVFTQVMDQMHYDIYGAPYGADREHVESIPFFRSVFDNINIGELRVEGTPPQAAVGNSAYRQTLRVFQYGQLFSWGSYVLERPWMWNDPEQTQHEDYFRSLAGIFRDGGLLKFHKGTLVRRPAMRTSLDPDFTAFPFGINDAGNAHILATDFNAVTPEDVSIFPMGMYRHPNGSYAIAVTNPWLEGAPSPFVVAERVEGAYEISIDLSKYKGLKDGAFVVVRLGSVPEGEILAEDSDTSGLRLNGTLAPGETHVYTLRPLR
jgi:hypothetical protein